MSVIGNRPPPYGKQGIASCLANIRRDVEKLRCILGESALLPGDIRREAVVWAFDAIEFELKVVEKWLPAVMGNRVGEVEQGGEVNKL